MTRTTACLFLGLVIGAAGSGCTKQQPAPEPPPRPELQAAAARLAEHYRKTPLLDGWSIAAITASGNRLGVTVTIPAEQASGIMRRPADDQFRLVAARACPAPADQIWRTLPADSGVTILPSVSGQVFIEVHCRP